MKWLARINFSLGGAGGSAPLWRLQDSHGGNSSHPPVFWPFSKQQHCQVFILLSSPEFFNAGPNFLQCQGTFTVYIYVHGSPTLGGDMSLLSGFIFCKPFFSHNNKTTGLWYNEGVVSVLVFNLTCFLSEQLQMCCANRHWIGQKFTNASNILLASDVTVGQQTFFFPANCVSWFWPTGLIAVEGRQQEADDGVLLFSGAH